MLLALALAAVQQQPVAYTSPASGDTVGYWQQRVRYTIAATLDERPGVLHATGRLVYVNNSPDTLRELYVHQYLNAFRPGSRWSAADAREGRVRFQRLAEPDYAYERFTATPTVGGAPVRPEYPGAPDSTVVRLALPRPLPPGDSLPVTFAWDARPSTVPRRQARAGRSFDFAHWYPKVAVYDRRGWAHHALVPAGEFYGEFGSFDVTLALREDQVVGATGVPVSGDPGWAGAQRGGVLRPAAAAYGAPPAGPALAAPAGYKTVRFVAHDVHHFGWSASPDYRYEGAAWVRPAGGAPGTGPAAAAPDTVSIHVLYRPGDEATWGNGVVAARTASALGWLDSIYGPYPYPQLTALHRIEGGGTEFPMLMMNGSPSQGLLLHEGGHVYTYGALANNEWRAAWMDEGLTTYQSEWAQGLTRQDRAGAAVPAPRAAGYRGRAVRPAASARSALDVVRLDLSGRAQPVGTRADAFTELRLYNVTVSTRAAQMYGALRDALGDSAFTAFLRDYYARWALKHVDEVAMRAAAERAAGAPLGWFFDQWVHRTGLVDYALLDARTEREGKGFVTRARVARRGEYRHPVPVGVRTVVGWTVRRGDPLRDEQTVEVRTDARPLEVRLDPFATTEDWYRPNDVAGGGPLDPRRARVVPGWPLLDQESESRRVIGVTPLIWTGTPGGPTGAVRVQSNYAGNVQRLDLGLAVSQRRPDGSPSASRVQAWAAIENPRLFGARRPAMGVRAGGWALDGMARLEGGKSWNRSPFIEAAGPRTSLTLGAVALLPYDQRWPDPSRWSLGRTYELRGAYERRADAIPRPTLVRAEVGGGYATAGGAVAGAARRTGYLRATAEARRLFPRAAGRQVTMLRAYAGVSAGAPRERLVYASSLDPVQTFENHFFRPRGGLLAGPDARYVSVGNGGLRAYDFRLAGRALAAVNAEHAVRLRRFGPADRPFDVYADAFADAGVLPDAPGSGALADAGVGLAARGALFDRDVRFRLDFPLYAERPALVVSARRNNGDQRVGPRASFSFTDLW